MSDPHLTAANLPSPAQSALMPSIENPPPSSSPATRQGMRGHARAALCLKAAATFWFTLAVTGQAVFLAYIVSFYGRVAVSGDPTRANKVLATGYIPGDGIGNSMLALHIAVAALITLGGPLQVLPWIRNRFPRFHRWNGRVYVAIVVLASIAGSFLIWTRHTIGDITQHIGTTSNGLAIVVCAALALRFALARDFTTHRRWALRLFIAASGSWFFRVGLMLSMAINRGPFGFDPERFEGPFLSFLTFAQYLLPLAILETYLRARDGNSAAAKFAAAAILVISSLAMGLGIFTATLGMWWRHIVR